MYANNGEVHGFLRADGQRLVNGQGEEILLRGVGLGNWLLPEGYMWKFPPDKADRPRRIEKLIRDLIGETEATSFWTEFRQHYISEQDVARMAEEGLNSVRLPINARFLLEDGDQVIFKESSIGLIDQFIDWCKQYKLYVILDLHGAPGGQTGQNIDDSEHDQPELFIDKGYRRQTIQLWKALADRYKDEWIIGGYDLLNEPLPNFFNQYNDMLMPLYKEITEAIREVDAKHLIILEGAHWATDWSVFTEMFDNNILLQFHKYWSSIDTESIAPYLDKRLEFNVPIYMGEGGENTLSWYTGAFGMYEDHHISWNFWTWKKLDTFNSPCSINKPQDWNLILEYLRGGEKPDRDRARAILRKYLDNIRFHNCHYQPQVLNAVQRKLPLRIPAEYFDYQGEGISYNASNLKQPGNNPFRPSDRIPINFIQKKMARRIFI
ncbi:glycoside hydrolase family 5 protein [Paenibacillus sp. D2_2]|uniref:glycoside hydrolase family 5 protein n=1 Tax=Paenibacillus sp. D2_2 TaxID=3073092 RepID=UPI00281575FB|nr:glycoside hydrolase family 5 protein [Paenibacillus sp. D2_2]WMT40611.1 glycoside hydrolase family 5 protein [Paenibacillus sp. D2_2]